MIIPKLHRKKNHRQGLFRNQVTSLILFERIITTEGKARATVSITNKMISLARKGRICDVRAVFSYLNDKKAAKKLLEVILPRMEGKNSGLVRRVRVGRRLGDGAVKNIVELVDYKPIEKPDEVIEEKSSGKPQKEDKRLEIKRDKKLAKLTKKEVKGEITTLVRKKGERRISNEK